METKIIVNNRIYRCVIEYKNAAMDTINQ